MRKGKKGRIVNVPIVMYLSVIIQPCVTTCSDYLSVDSSRVTKVIVKNDPQKQKNGL